MIWTFMKGLWPLVVLVIQSDVTDSGELRDRMLSDAPLQSRVVALSKVCDTVDGAERIANIVAVERLVDIILSLEGDQKTTGRSSYRIDSIRLLDMFVREYATSYSENAEIRDRLEGALVRLVRARRPQVDSAATRAFAAALLDIEEDDAGRRSRALEIMELYPQSDPGLYAGHYIVRKGLYSPDVAVHLRDALARDLAAGEEPSRATVYILGDRGDTAVAPILREYLNAQMDPSAIRDAAELALWRVAIQENSENILSYLRECDFHSQREWVILRAVEIGISREQLRTALFEFYQCEGENMRTVRGLGVDDAVVGTGLLSEEELPGGERISIPVCGH